MNMDSIESKTIGVIGFGNFGKVICKYLFPKNKIAVYSNELNNVNPFNNCKPCGSLKDLVNSADIIIPAIPIKKFEEVIKQISSTIAENQIVMEICSVMEYPVEVMKKYLPENSKMIASHPMFGPNSIQKNKNILNGFKIVLSNISLDKNLYSLFKNYFLNLNLNVVELSPVEHDEYSAKSQFFALLIGQIAQDLHLKKTQIDTPGANAIFDSIPFMGPDREIIEDMITYNKFCSKIHKEIVTVLDGLKNS